MLTETMVSVPAREICRLREENDTLRALLADAQSVRGADPRIVARLKLTPRESILLGLMLSRPMATTEAILFHLFSDDYATAEKGVHVAIHKLRKKLPEGVSIETFAGTGYALSPASRARLLSLTSRVILWSRIKGLMARKWSPMRRINSSTAMMANASA